MNYVYKVLDKIREHFLDNGITHQVSYGDYSELDTHKTGMFPITHVDILKATHVGSTIVFDVLVLCADIEDRTISEESEDEFFKGTNIHDIYNEQLICMSRFIESARRGDLFDLDVRLVNTPESEPFESRFDNVLAGWVTTVRLEVRNITGIC